MKNPTKNPSNSGTAPTRDAADSVQALAEQLHSARERLALLGGDAPQVLAEVPSEAELAAERELAEWRRSALRAAERAELAEQLAAAESLRKAQAEIREADIRDAVDARKALAEQRRADTPVSNMAELRRAGRYIRIACATIIAAGMLWSAINVQQNMAPGGTGDPLFWVSYLIEAMISGLLIVIALGVSKARELADLDPPAATRMVEVGLLVLTLGLNTYPHLSEGHWYDAALHAIAPVMIGGSLLALHGLGSHYMKARKRIAERIHAQGGTDTVHLPAIDTVQTVHRAPSYRTELTEKTVHGPGAQTVQLGETVHRANASDPETVHLATAVEEITEQLPRTEQPTAAHLAHASVATPHSAYTAQPGLHTEQHTVQADSRGSHYDGRPAVSELEQGAAGQLDLVMSDAPILSTDTAQTPGQDLVSTSTRGPETAQPTPAHTQVGVGEGRVRTVVSTGGEQFPRTEQPTGQAETVHRAPVTETVHRADPETVDETAQPEAGRAAREAATAQHGEDDSDLWALGAEVHGRLRRTRFSVEDVVRVLIANRRDGLGADRIYRDKLGPHRDTTTKWIELAAQIDAERTASMAPVVRLHERA
ncbi:hypothetical protein AB0M22_45100 [Nocardia sp. NPDC051756]|uniref:hypothetical protein n=1 Tax=Nocardia sp. NPDC051756 TaxID=3154751 RepID=UPI003426C7E8